MSNFFCRIVLEAATKVKFLEEKVLLVGIKIRISKEMTAAIAIETVQSASNSEEIHKFGDHLNQSIRP